MLQPLGDHIVVKPGEAEQVTASGIVLPDTAQKKPREGKVLAVGPGKVLENGERAPLSVKKGDLVLFAKYGGTEVEVSGDELLSIRESDLLAVIEG